MTHKSTSQTVTSSLRYRSNIYRCEYHMPHRHRSRVSITWLGTIHLANVDDSPFGVLKVADLDLAGKFLSVGRIRLCRQRKAPSLLPAKAVALTLGAKNWFDIAVFGLIIFRAGFWTRLLEQCHSGSSTALCYSSVSLLYYNTVSLGQFFELASALFRLAVAGILLPSQGSADMSTSYF